MTYLRTIFETVAALIILSSAPWIYLANLCDNQAIGETNGH